MGRDEPRYGGRGLPFCILIPYISSGDYLLLVDTGTDNTQRQVDRLTEPT